MDHLSSAFSNRPQSIVCCAIMGTSSTARGHHSVIERNATNKTCLVKQRAGRHECGKEKLVFV